MRDKFDVSLRELAFLMKESPTSPGWGHEDECTPVKPHLTYKIEEICSEEKRQILEQIRRCGS